ncbi:MAG: SRPBCC family protein [Myxococcota bacterium]
MSVDFEHSVEIERPAAEVFAYVADFANNPKWQAGMRSCEWTSAEPGVVGATYVQQASFLGRRIDTHFEVTELEPGRSISIASTVSTFPIQVTRTVEPLSEGRCRVTAHVRGQPTGLLKLLSGMVKKSVRKDYAKLRQTLEQS